MLFQQLCENICAYTKSNGNTPGSIELTNTSLSSLVDELHLRDSSNKKTVKEIRERIKVKTGVWVKIKIY